MSNRRRTEELSINFVNQKIDGWTFIVGDFFRMQLDIRLDERMDVEKNIEKKKRLGRALSANEKIKRSVWTQGTPSAYSFDRGHVFHEARESDDGIRRSIVVLLARPDPGALVEKQVSDEVGTELTVVAEAEEASSKEGFIDYEVLRYKNGILLVNEVGIAIKEKSSRTQSGFVEYLRTGK